VTDYNSAFARLSHPAYLERARRRSPPHNFVASECSRARSGRSGAEPLARRWPTSRFADAFLRRGFRSRSRTGATTATPIRSTTLIYIAATPQRTAFRERDVRVNKRSFIAVTAA